MEQSTKAPKVLRFDVFEVDFQERELRKSGQKVKIQEQPFQILLLLLERPGAVLAREDLRKALWPDGTFVDFEHGLNTAVKKLREVLGDSAEAPRFVETVARRGYRFIGNLEKPGPAPSIPPARRRLFTVGYAVAVGLAVCVLALLGYYTRSRRSEASQPLVIPLVTDVGDKFAPSLSPDGQHLAFAWNGGRGPFLNLYVKLVGTEESLRLTNRESIDTNPVWSADGRYIAFCRIAKGETGIYIIPALGGVERRLRQTHWEESQFYQIFWYEGCLAWSPDGRYLAFSDRASLSEPASSIFLLSADSQEVRRLTSPSLRSRGDFSPQFSPDGQTVAFIRGSHGIHSVYTVPVSGGEEHLLTSGATYNEGLTFTADGRYIVFAKASWLANAGWLWKISLRGGEPERLQFGEQGVEPSIRGNRLVYVREMTNLSIWRRRLKSALLPGPSDRFISSTKMESGPQFSPDGRKIAFESTRSGAYEVWMCRSDGSGLVQLTHFNSVTGTPRWSPDGQQLVFDSRATGNADIFVTNFLTGPPRRLTSELSTDIVPSWSQDGRWIFFASDRSGKWQVWKMPSGGGTAVQVTHRQRSKRLTADFFTTQKVRPFLDYGAFRLTAAKRPRL